MSSISNMKSVDNFWSPGLASTISFVRNKFQVLYGAMVCQSLRLQEGIRPTYRFPAAAQCTYSISKFSNELGCYYSFPTAKVNTKTFRPCWSPLSWCIDSTKILSDCTTFAHNIYRGHYRGQAHIHKTVRKNTIQFQEKEKEVMKRTILEIRWKRRCKTKCFWQCSKPGAIMQCYTSAQ